MFFLTTRLTELPMNQLMNFSHLSPYAEQMFTTCDKTWDVGDGSSAVNRALFTQHGFGQALVDR